MTLRFTNVKTGQVQAVIEGSRLHRLVEANPDGYVPVEVPVTKRTPKKETTDGTRRNVGRPSRPRAGSDGD